MENIILQNDKRSIRYRRDRSTLVILGTGVIIFGFWSVIKLAAYLILDIPIFDVSEMEGMEEADLPMLMNILYVMTTGDVLVRVFVGLNAISEGRSRNGRLNGGLYLAFNVWMIIFEIFSVASVIWTLYELTDIDEIIEYFLLLFMEISSLVIVIEVFAAALSARHYKVLQIRRRYAGNAG